MEKKNEKKKKLFFCRYREKIELKDKNVSFRFCYLDFILSNEGKLQYLKELENIFYILLIIFTSLIFLD